MHRRVERRVTQLWLTIGLALIAAVAITLTTSQSGARTRTGATPSARPTVVLVNGAWANSASWSGVIARLQSEGYTVDAPPNPLRSLQGDAATIAGFLKTIKGPIVSQRYVTGRSTSRCMEISVRWDVIATGERNCFSGRRRALRR